MAENDRLNLIEEFEQQKGNNFVILTTFNFDPFFFDCYLLPKLQEQNRASEIVVLIDESQYELSYPNFTNVTGVSYHLVPIKLSRGVFHPKFFLFVSKDYVSVYYGSANLTLQGFTNNAEIITYHNIERKNGITKDVVELKELLLDFAFNGVILDEDVVSIIKNLVKNLDEDLLAKADEIKILHNRKTPILDQVLRHITEKDLEELFVLAPFITNSENIVQQIFTQLGIKKFRLGLQRGNHNLSDISKIEQFCKKSNMDFEIDEADFVESVTGKDDLKVPRRFHSKIIHLKGQKSYVLLGSPNFTQSALQATMDSGNFELGVFLENPPSKLLEEIKLAPAKTSELLTTSNQIEFVASSSPISIISVKFTPENKKLQIKTEPLDKTLTVRMRTKQDPFNPILLQHNFISGILEQDLDGIPVEIEIQDSTSVIRRRIFDDSDPLRKFFRGGFSMRKLISQNGGILSLDFNSLMEILKVVNSVSQKQSLPSKQSTDLQTDKQYFPSTSKMHIYLHNTLDSLSKLISPIEENKRKALEIETLGDEEDLDEGVSMPTLENEIKKEQQIKKTLRDLYSILLLYNQKSENENFVDSIVFYISTFLQFLPSLTAYDEKQPQKGKDVEARLEIFDIFQEKLEDLFDKIPEKDIQKANQNNLLLSAICLHMISKIFVTNEKFYSCLYSFNFFDKNRYYTIKEEARKFFVKNYGTFDEENFNKSMANFAFIRFKVNIRVFVQMLCSTMQDEEDLIVLRYLADILTTIHSRFTSSTFSHVKYNKNTKGGQIISQILVTKESVKKSHNIEN